MDRQNILLEVLAELERRERNRHMNRFLRDASDPFFIPEENFRKCYRLSREAARDLFLEISPHMNISRRVTKIPSVVRFITALHFFAEGSYQKSIGKDQHCSVSQSEVSNSLHEIVNILVEHAAARYIRFPRNLADVTRVKTGFFQKFGFPGILGCIDGTHILIVPPPAGHDIFPGRIFINRKQRHSLNCQIICDSDLNILSINARFPGSVHDSAIWMMSGVKRILMDNYTNRRDMSTWLLGDSGYPLQPFLLTPIVGADPQTPEGQYTRAHKSIRNSVERCIGVLKSYFRCLLKDRVLHYAPDTAAKIVYACAILHNILRSRNIVDNNIEIVYDDPDPQNILIGDEDFLEQGRQIRNGIILQHFR